MLRKIIKIALVVVALAFAVAQFVRPDFINPPVVESETLWASAQVPVEVRQVIARSCADCHSNETTYPWYSHVTPFNWFLADHIEHGRHELNLSTWNTYPRERKMHKLDEICEQVEGGFMPLPSYLWIHWDATLSDADRILLCGWAKAERERIESAP